MQFAIYRNGEEINVIESSEDYCKLFCNRFGYTYKEVPKPDEPETVQRDIPYQPTLDDLYYEHILVQQEITDLELNDIEHGQQITDLELMMLGGTNDV